MHVHWLQHTAHENLGSIAPWIAARGWPEPTRTRLFAGEPLPALDAFDWLMAMGGPMNVDEHDAHPWLAGEKVFIADAIAAGKKVLGICLGAQLIARALGQPVTRNAHVELGWHPVRLVGGEDGAAAEAALAGFPLVLKPFHWHGDTFALPAEATLLMASEACAHQAYSLHGGRVFAIQFHLEVTAADAREWFASPGETPAPSTYVQTPEEVLHDLAAFADNTLLMRRLLDNLAAVG